MDRRHPARVRDERRGGAAVDERERQGELRRAGAVEAARAERDGVDGDGGGALEVLRVEVLREERGHERRVRAVRGARVDGRVDEVGQIRRLDVLGDGERLVKMAATARRGFCALHFF